MVSRFYLKKYIDNIKNVILNQRFKKFQKINEKVFRIQLNRQNIYIKIDEGFEVKKETISGIADPFCMVMRKYLNGAKLIDVKQLNYDRIVCFTFDGGGKVFHLICEFFGKGDIFLCDENFNILISYNKTKKGKYSLEKNNWDPNSFEEFKNLFIENFDENVSKTLAKTFKLGGEYSIYLCKKLNIDPKEKDIGKLDFEKIYQELKNLIENPPVEKVEKEFNIKIVQTKEKKKKLSKEEIQLLNIDKDIEKHMKKAEKYYKIAKLLEDNIQFLEEIIELYNKKNIEDLKKKGVKIKEGKLFISFES